MEEDLLLVKRHCLRVGGLGLRCLRGESGEEEAGAEIGRFHLRIIALGVALCGLGFASGCGNSVPADVPSKLDFGAPAGVIEAEPRRHDLGVVVGGTKDSIDVRTRIMNTGMGDLLLGDVVASCACTHASLSRKRLRPGEETYLLSTIRLGEVAEPRTTRVQIASSDKRTPQIDITFDWKVDSPLKLPEASLRLSSIKPRTPHSMTMPLTVQYLQLCGECTVDVRCSSSRLAAAWKPGTRPEGREHTIDHSDPIARLAGWLTVDIQPQTENVQYSETVILELQCRGNLRSRLILPVVWTVESSLRLSPSRLFAGSHEGGHRKSIKLLINGAEASKLEILGIACEGGLIEDHSLERGQVGTTTVTLEIRFPTDKGPWRRTIRMATNMQDEAEIEVPISGITN